MGTFYCKDCHYGVDSSEVTFYEDGYYFDCPRCGANCQWEDDGRGLIVTNPNRIPKDIDTDFNADI